MPRAPARRRVRHPRLLRGGCASAQVLRKCMANGACSAQLLPLHEPVYRAPRANGTGGLGRPSAGAAPPPRQSARTRFMIHYSTHLSYNQVCTTAPAAPRDRRRSSAAACSASRGSYMLSWSPLASRSWLPSAPPTPHRSHALPASTATLGLDSAPSGVPHVHAPHTAHAVNARRVQCAIRRRRRHRHHHRRRRPCPRHRCRALPLSAATPSMRPA